MNMRALHRALLCAALFTVTTPAFAQEVIVTGQRRALGYSETRYAGDREIVATGRPVIVLKRTADFVVLPVRIVGDTRDLKQRRDDLKATIRNAIELAGKSGVELAVGDYVVKPLTLGNYGDLVFVGDGRPDTDQTVFLVKARLEPGGELGAAKAKLTRFIQAVPTVGRSTMFANGEETLSVVNPDQYRGAIIELIAADAKASAARFGPQYGVQVTGLDRPVEWSRAGSSEVFLYLMSSYTVVKD
jgi:hypothetical protein